MVQTALPHIARSAMVFRHQIRGLQGMENRGGKGDQRRSSWAEYLLGDQSKGLIWVKRLLGKAQQSPRVKEIWQGGVLSPAVLRWNRGESIS